MDFSSVKVEKVRDNDNWLQWRIVIRTLLEEDEDLLKVCGGTLVAPVEGVDNFDTLSVKYKKADKAARKLIVKTVDKKPLDLLLCCTSAKEMWSKLNAVYDMKSDENNSMVQKHISDFQWDLIEGVAHNLSKLEQLSVKMKALGSEISMEMMIARIMTTIPKQFNHFHSAWDLVDEARKNIENLTTRLMAEELRLQSQEMSDEEAVALLSKSRGHFGKQSQWKKENNRSSGENKNFRCFTCGIRNHTRKDCPGCFICGSKCTMFCLFST